MPRLLPCRIVVMAVCLATPTIMSGCGQPETIPISGTISLDGQPVAGGAVLFLPETDGTFASKASVRDGKFAFRAPGGLRAGQYLCVLADDVVESNPEDPSAADAGKDPQASLPENLPAKYRKKSDLRINVSRSSCDFRLELSSAIDK